MTSRAEMVQTQCDHATVDLSDNSTTVFDGPCLLYGVYINTALSAQACPIQDGSQGVRTNLILQSEDLSTTWTNTRSTDSQAAGISPDGTNNANSINEDSSLDTHFVDQVVTLANSTQYTYSVYAKASNRTWVFLQCYGIPGSFSVYFDLATGAIGTAVSNDDAGIEAVGNGWYRCWVTFTTGTVTTPHAIIVPSDGNDGISYQGLTQESILAWGVQLEAGALTDYIPTTDTARSADYPVFVLPASTPAGTYKELPGIRFNDSLFVDPDDVATGTIEIIYRRVNPN